MISSSFIDQGVKVEAVKLFISFQWAADSRARNFNYLLMIWSWSGLQGWQVVVFLLITSMDEQAGYECRTGRYLKDNYPSTVEPITALMSCPLFIRNKIFSKMWEQWSGSFLPEIYRKEKPIPEPETGTELPLLLLSNVLVVYFFIKVSHNFLWKNKYSQN